MLPLTPDTGVTILSGDLDDVNDIGDATSSWDAIGIGGVLAVLERAIGPGNTALFGTLGVEAGKATSEVVDLRDECGGIAGASDMGLSIMLGEDGIGKGGLSELVIVEPGTSGATSLDAFVGDLG